MSSSKFCRKFVEIHKIPSIDIKMLIDDIQRLLIQTEKPKKSVIRNGVTKYFNNELTDLFVDELFDELNLSPKKRPTSFNYERPKDSNPPKHSQLKPNDNFTGQKRTEKGFTRNYHPTYKGRSSREELKVYHKSFIYVAGLSPQLNSVSRLYQYFHHYGQILGIQVKREECYGLIEFQYPRSAYQAVESKRPAFGNKLIQVGYASEIDKSYLETLRQREEEQQKQEIEMKTALDSIEAEQDLDFSYDMSDSESYDIPD